MFDSLQEGIIVLQDGKLNFMNELSNRILTELTDLGNFYKNRTMESEICKDDPLDRKLFYLFQNAGEEGVGTKKKKKKKGTSSDYSKHSSEYSNQ
jgi:hypothetical protein